jgi:Electron transfer DM13
MRPFLVRNRTVLIPIGVVLAAVAVYLAFFVFAIQTLIVDDTVDEAGPVFDSGAGASVEEDPAAPATTAPVDAGRGGETNTTDQVESEVESEVESDVAPVASTNEVVTLLSGSFIDRSHPSSGTASVLGDGTAQRFLRFEEFATDNGPDLNVYLSAAPADAAAGDFDDDFVDLGDLLGNVGNQNYEIPADVDLGRYSTVVIWCVRFGVAFGAADLT